MGYLIRGSAMLIHLYTHPHPHDCIFALIYIIYLEYYDCMQVSFLITSTTTPLNIVHYAIMPITTKGKKTMRPTSAAAAAAACSHVISLVRSCAHTGTRR